MFVTSPTPRRLLRAVSIVVLTAVTSTLAAYGQEIPNPSFEQPQIQPSPGFITPGSPGHAAAAAMLQWAFGYNSGVCIEGKHHAAGLSAAEGSQVAFIQGQKDGDDGAPGPLCIFGVDVTGLQPGEEYEISWQQTGRASDIGTGAVAVHLHVRNEDGQMAVAPPVVLFQKEPVATKGQWETKSAWFTATAPTMRIQVFHFIHEAGNPPDDPETTLFDDFKIRAGRSAD
jgi:hypothetical protein